MTPPTDAQTEPIGEKAGCPVVHYDIGARRPVGSYFADQDRMRETADIFWNEWGGTGGFWMLMRHDLVREAFQTTEVFSSDATIVTIPDPQYHWIPTMENPPQHTDFRRLLNGTFSPRRVNALDERIREHCRASMASFVDNGRADLVAEFAMEFPTRVFLEIVGLPTEDTEDFVTWVETIFAGFSDPALMDDMAAAQASIRGYFEELLEDRKRHPRPDEEEDFFTILAHGTVKDRPLTDEEFLNIAEVIVLAGLDTIKSQLGYMFHHLATHPEDRQRLLDEPEIIPYAVEEFLRVHAIVMDGRQVAEDTEFHGCPMKKGDMVLVNLPAASRDPREFEDATEVVLDRKVNRHLALAGGPHRCLGAHLARKELAIALEEFHAAIPSYRLDPDQGEILESGPQLGLDKLVLLWED